MKSTSQSTIINFCFVYHFTYHQAVNMFTAAFQSGQLGPLMAQFGLGDKATEAANKGGRLIRNRLIYIYKT